ncbi:MAG: YihY/virulence factor BrkB family protein [Flammeovirgaceae bacterium]|nr:YihY/virulence factor BrkB family protein [Flammeovirgaceae bacterium]
MKVRARRFILKFPSVRLTRDWLKSIRFKKYEDVSLYRLLKIFGKNIQENEIVTRANGVSFNFILAIFPAIIFVFTLIPYISTYFPTINNEAIIEFIKTILPGKMEEAVSTTIEDIVHNQRGGLLTFGFFFALFLSTNGMMSLMSAFNACYKTVEKRNVFKMRLTAIGLTFMLAAVVFLSITLLVVGQITIDYISQNLSDFRQISWDQYTLYVILTLRFVVIFIMFFIAISSIFYFGPAIHYNWRFFSIGSTFSTFACLAVSYGFSYYITNFGTYNKVYGSIGVLIALMIWIQLLTIILLFGYEINASLHQGRKFEAVDSHKRTKRMEQLKMVE